MGNIRVLGSKSSGKTTYLAALAYSPENKKKNVEKSYFEVQAIGDDAKKLANQAENIICEGDNLDVTVLEVGGVSRMPDYTFRIEVNFPFQKQRTIDLNVRDYPGEIFDDIISSKPEHQPFIEECLTASVEGCLILISEWGRGQDRFYRQAFEQFINLMDNEGRSDNLRLAVVMSKCERGELWPGRIEPKIDIFEQHFPETKNLLESRFKLSPQNLEFFALSTFGVLHRNDPRPNRVNEGTSDTKSTLRKPEIWQPYGMIAPIYWLSTGKKMRRDS
jgi:Double-GTPase 1